MRQRIGKRGRLLRSGPLIAKARAGDAIARNLFCEHGKRADPQAVRTLQRLVQHQRLLRFAVLHHAPHAVEIALEMPVKAGPQSRHMAYSLVYRWIKKHP